MELTFNFIKGVMLWHVNHQSLNHLRVVVNQKAKEDAKANG